MVGIEAMSAMKPTAFLLNLARGAVVDEKALIRALELGTLRARVWMFSNEEPLPQGILSENEKCHCDPSHRGTSTFYASQVLPIFQDNLRRYLRGERHTLINVVDH